MTFLLHKGGTRRGMMPMPMHYYDAEADFPLTNPSGWKRGRPRLVYQDYLRLSEIKTHFTRLNINKGFCPPLVLRKFGNLKGILGGIFFYLLQKATGVGTIIIQPIRVEYFDQ